MLEKFMTGFTLCNFFVLTMVIMGTLDWDLSTILWFIYSIWEILWGTLSSPWLILRMTVRWTQGNWPTPPTLTIINSFWTCTVIWCGPKSLALLATFRGLHLLFFKKWKLQRFHCMLKCIFFNRMTIFSLYHACK